MRHTKLRATGTVLLLCSFAAGVVGCGGSSGGSSGPGAGVSGFELVSISVPNNAEWQLNRRIEFTFSQAVDFQSISTSSINVATLAGKPALGNFFLKSVPAPGGGETVLPNVVVWQPRCPTLPDFSDSGLDAGGVVYQVLVQGSDIAGGIAVKSASNQVLKNSQARLFTTPNSPEVTQLFFDPVPGPPAVVVRQQGSTVLDASYVELGGDPNQREYFERDSFGNPVTILDMPINLLSDTSQAISVLLEFDQPLDPSAGNVTQANLGLEYFNTDSATWIGLPVSVEFEANCTKAGARVRLRPLGILPQDSLLRARLGSGLKDLVGQSAGADSNNFARFRTGVLSVPGLTPVGDLADELFEPFLVGGNDAASLEDTTAVFAEPAALWGGGTLSPNFNFLGTGGPGGNFDLEILGTFNFNTVSQVVTGGPGFTPATQQTATNGILNVRNLRIAPGALLQVQGANPLRIFATGTVEILGEINLDGVDAEGVNQLGSPNLPDPGAPGRAGGGRGGFGSPLTTSSSPKGGDGDGAFNVPGLGGTGGESSFAAAADANRRGAGGGGGSFSANANLNLAGQTNQTPTAGQPGTATATSAVSKSGPAQGGPPGPVPFFDATPTNDFFGVRQTGPTTFVKGEMSQPLAGSGGGGGGDSINSSSFPQPGWGTIASFTNERKGAGGGGGGGQLQILAIGNIVLGNGGRINARGGNGGRGENTGGLNSIGGSSGGGSGGHIILQTAANVISQNAPSGSISTLGGASGPGAVANVGVGGRGGTGVVQIHTQSPSNIVGNDGVTPLTTAQINALCRPAPWLLLPDFGRISKARSKFVPLGGANQNPATSLDQVLFAFGGTVANPASPNAGEVLSAGGQVTPVAPVLTGSPLTLDTTNRRVIVDAQGLVDDDNDPQTLFFNDIYLRNPALLREFGLRLTQGIVTRTFTIAAASYDSNLVQLTLDLDATGGPLTGFDAGVASFQLIPRFFRVITGSSLDSLPASASVAVRFQAVASGADGQPDLVSAPLVDWTSDISEFNSPALTAEVGFFRFEVEFNLDVQGAGLSANSPRPALQFLRVPIRF